MMNSDDPVNFAYYKAKDPLQNFKFRVTVRKLKSISSQDKTSTSEEDVYTFSWKENLEKRTNVTLEDGSVKDLQFLYSTFETQDLGAISSLGSRHLLPHVTPSVVNIVDQRRAQRELSKPNQAVCTMRIMADVSYSEPSEPQQLSLLQRFFNVFSSQPQLSATSEHGSRTLCVIDELPGGVLRMRPDFNSHGDHYTFHTNLGEVFQYSIMHASKQISQKEALRERKRTNEEARRRAEFLASAVGRDFQIPDSSTFRLMVFGEIETGSDFEFDSVAVRFLIEIPKDWSSPSLLSDVTNRCSMTQLGGKKVAAFGLPFELELLYRSSALARCDCLPTWPLMFFEVTSVDSWGRYRVEGYGYCRLPIFPGTTRVTVACWRPAGQYPLDDLRRFFTGGSPELEDLSYTALPSTFQGDRLSRLGFRAVSSGTLRVRFNSLCQSRESRREPPRAALHQEFGVDAGLARTLAAFQRARQRMIAARDNLVRDMSSIVDDTKEL